MRLSELEPIDLESMREVSLQRARQELDAGRVRAAHVDIYVDKRRPVLGDGRHRIVVAMRRGFPLWPVIITTYGPRGGIRSRRRESLELDALP